MTRINADKDTEECEGFERNSNLIDSSPLVSASELTSKAVLPALIRSYPRHPRHPRQKM